MLPVFPLILLLLSNSARAAGFACTPANEIHWQELSEGVRWAEYDLSFTPYLKAEHSWAPEQNRRVRVRAFKVDYSRNRLLFHRSETDLGCDLQTDHYARKLVEDSGAPVIGAVNASFFSKPQLDILGLALDEKRLWSSKIGNLKIASAGVFGLKKGVPFLETRKEFIRRHGTVMSRLDARRYSFVIQAYPRLVVENELQVSDRVMEAKRPRTSIGVVPDSGGSGELLLVTIDADGENSETGMSLYEYAHFLKTAACGVRQKTALNLDGGGSTSFVIPSKGIYHQVERCRRLANILTIQKR
jgi:hypothetical protein